MKKMLLLTVALVLVAGIASAGVVGSAHDMRTYITGASATQQVCVYCHTPHGASGINIDPLWNHSMSTNATYGIYTSDTMNVTPQELGAGTTISHLCLSCHDGTVGVNSLIKTPGDQTGPGTIGGPLNTSTGAILSTAGGYLGTDLTNDHPVNFNYDTSAGADNGIRTNPTGSVAIFGTTGNRMVQCASCHQVHDNTNVPFLRMTNVGSALCLACHIK